MREPRTLRTARVPISLPLLAELLGFRGGDIRSIHADERAGTAVFVVEHPALPETAEGDLLQEAIVEFAAVTVPVPAGFQIMGQRAATEEAWEPARVDPGTGRIMTFGRTHFPNGMVVEVNGLEVPGNLSAGQAYVVAESDGHSFELQLPEGETLNIASPGCDVHVRALGSEQRRAVGDEIGQIRDAIREVEGSVEERSAAAFDRMISEQDALAVWPLIRAPNGDGGAESGGVAS